MCASSFLDVTGVGFCLFVVVDADEKDIACVLLELGWVVLALDLVDSSIGFLVVFQFGD